MQTEDNEYLVSFGRSGEFGRFHPAGSAYQRGDRVVVRTEQGMELGVVLCAVTPGHRRFLSRTAQGQLLRQASSDDEHAAGQQQQRGERLFDDCRRLAADLGLTLQVLDVEVLLDGRRAVVHFLGQPDCDPRPLARALTRQHDLVLDLQNLALPRAASEESCGRPGCGGGGGSCTSCASGGCGNCSQGARKEDVGNLLSDLHTAGTAIRTSLL